MIEITAFSHLNLTFGITLQKNHNRCDARLIKESRGKESKRGTMKQMKQLSCTSHERTIDNITKTDHQIEKI